MIPPKYSLDIAHKLEEAYPTPKHISRLRKSCFARDRHRCVVSQNYDRQKAYDQWEQNGYDAEIKDDDGQVVEVKNIARLDVAYIIPRCFMTQRKRDSDMGIVSEPLYTHTLPPSF